MLGSATLDAKFWFYFFNAILLIIHEIDSGHWKEWKIFNIHEGIIGFLLLHIPIQSVILSSL